MTDLLLTGATLLTGDLAQPVVEDGFLAITGRRISGLGPCTALSPSFDTAQRLALPGRVIVPGFVNLHTHAVLCLMRGIALDMGHAPAYTPGVPHGHEIAPDEAVALARLGALEALLFGSTVMADSYVHADLTLPAMAELGLRVFACGRVHDVDFSRVHDGEWRYDDAIGDDTLAATRALIAAHHGSHAGRANVILAPHAPDTCSDRLLQKVAAMARDVGLRVMIHLSQSPAENTVIRERSGATPAELLARLGLLNDRLIAAHCIHVTGDDVARIGGAGVTVAHVPKGNATGGSMAPTPALRAAGARLALGTDNLTQDMAEAMRWALAVARVQERAVDPSWQPRDVFQMATANGAAALGLAHEMGRLATGYLADLAVFDFRRPHLAPCLDPLGTLVHDAQGRDVEHVFVDGRHVVRDGKPVLVDETAIRVAAQTVAERLWARARAVARVH
jgi:5-methylthioadenosine/S-adenosylhomocysteine deaminase